MRDLIATNWNADDKCLYFISWSQIWSLERWNNQTFFIYDCGRTQLKVVLYEPFWRQTIVSCAYLQVQTQFHKFYRILYFLLLLRKVLWFLQMPTDWIPIASCVTLTFKPYSNFQRCATKRSRRDSVGFVKNCTLTPTSDLVCTFLNTNFLNLHTDTTNTNWEYHESPYNHYGINQCLAGYWENAWLSTQNFDNQLSVT